jgi:phosphatidylserine synthase
LLGGLQVPTSVWGYVPAAMIAGAFLMASNLPIPKLQAWKSKPLTFAMLAFVLAGYACGFARTLPEFMLIMPGSWLIVSLVWSQLAPAARGLTPPSVLPVEPIPGTVVVAPLSTGDDREREA